MKPPVKLDDLMDEWSKDCKIDETEPGSETAKIPTLHSKYLRILTHHNLIVRKLQNEYNAMKAVKFQYYSGDLNNTEDLEKYGFEPWPKRVLRQDINMYLDSDKELTDLLLKKVIHQEIVDFCTSVLKEIGSRTYQLGNIIKWETFTGGMK
jgi:hypothetical protein